MADRTVSVRLRAEIGDFVAEFNLAGKAVDDFGKKVDGTTKKTEGLGKKTEESSKKTEESVKKTTESVRRSSASTGTWIASLVGAAAGIAAPFTAAGAAALAFGAVAAPSIAKVVAAQKDLTLQWVTLDARQKATSAHLTGVITEYQQLAKAYEPQALAIFNSALGDTSVLMQRAKPLLDAGAQGVSNLTSHIDSFVTGGTMTRFLNFAAAQAGPTFDKLGTTFDQTGTLALHLIQDLAPMGQTLLSTANGGLRLLNAVEQIDPHLVEMTATALALKAPTQALSDLWTSGASKVGAWANKTSEADGKLAKFAKGALSADSTLGKLGRTISASPNLYIGAALGIGYLVARLATMKDSTDNLIASVRTETGAIGNNAQGHLAAAASFSKYITQARAAEAAALDGGVTENAAQTITTQYGEKIRKLSQARKDELAAARNVTAGESDLADQYNLTAEKAGQLATAAGVDLSKGITGSGDAARAAQAKIRAYWQAVQQAQDPTFVVSNALDQAGNKALDLKTRMTALTNAFGALAGPELAAFDGTTKTAQAFDQLDAALKKSKGSMSLQTAAGQNARNAFAVLLSTVQANLDAQYQYNQATQGAAKALQIRTASARALLPVLLAEAAGNKQAQHAVLDWANAAGVGKTRTDALLAAVGQSKAAFIAAAQGAGKTRAEAEKLWAALNKIPGIKNIKFGDNAEVRRARVAAYQFLIDALHGKNVTISDNASAAAGRVNAVQAAINALHNRTVTITTRQVIETIEIGHRTQQAQNARADGGIDRYADGGLRRDLPPMVVAQPTVLFGETATGGEAYIPLGPGKRKRSVALLEQVAGMFGLSLTRMAAGGLLTGGWTAVAPWLSGPNVWRPSAPATSPAPSSSTSGFGITSMVDLNLGDIIQQWRDVVKPASKSDVNQAIKNRKTQIDQLRNAEDALARARRRHDPRAIAAAERRVRKERDDLREATKKLHDVENRYKFAKQSPATQLGSALALNIRNTGAFIANLTKLTDRGFGTLAQQLLAMGGPQAEKIAADAVKMSNAKLSKLNSQIGQSQQQQQQLANLPAILTARAAIKAGKGSSWVGLLNATGLTPDVLALAVRSMLTDLNKTAAGRALVADMHSHGYARGGIITGPAGVDRTLIRATAGEFMTNQRSSTKYRPWLEAINQDRLGEFVRHLVAGVSGGRAVAAAAPAAGGGPTINQTFQTQEMDKAELARAVARETAWAIG